MIWTIVWTKVRRQMFEWQVISESDMKTVFFWNMTDRTRVNFMKISGALQSFAGSKPSQKWFLIASGQPYTFFLKYKKAYVSTWTIRCSADEQNKMQAPHRRIHFFSSWRRYNRIVFYWLHCCFLWSNCLNHFFCKRCYNAFWKWNTAQEEWKLHVSEL